MACATGPVDGRPIRKVSRRARGAKWAAAVLDAAVVVKAGTATVAVHLPTPVDATPVQVARLQVSGLELNADSEDRQVRTGPDVLRILLSPHAQMSTGKSCAQVGHAAQVALMHLDRARVHAWARGGLALAVTVADHAEWELLTAPGRDDVAVVADAGFTEVASGTVTCAATFTR